MSGNKYLKIIISMLIVLVSINSVYAKRNERQKRSKKVKTELVKPVQDTLPANYDGMVSPHAGASAIADSAWSAYGAMDSIAVSADSLAISDSLSGMRDSIKIKQTLEYPAFSVARDSMIEDFSNGKRVIYYYGDIKVDYGTMSLTAEYMKYDVDENIVYASGLPDSTGNIVGRPVMTDNGVSYEMEDVYYNFTTKKAKIRNMITQQQEGILHGKNLKMMPDNSFNISGGKYTTCDHEHPHFYLQLTSAKVVTKPKQMTVFGPAYAVLEDVPTPFALPYGFVPRMATRASGILIPSYGEETSRGVFMRGLGYYFVIGDHWDVALTTDIYSLGSWTVNLNSRYKKRYKYDGSFSMTYANNQTGERGSPDFAQSADFEIRWEHAQDSKAVPGTSFRASVDFKTPAYNEYNSQISVSEHLESQASSSISYSKTWSGTPFSLSINALHSQNMRDSSYAFTLPNLTFTMNRIYPFKRKNRVGKEKIYESISFSYNATIENKINFKSSEFGKPEFWDKMKNGVRHNFNINLPSFSILKYLQVSPTVTYGMNWYFQDVKKVYNYETDEIETIQSDQFSTFGVAQNFSAGVSMSTRIYGTFNFKERSPIRAIRHMISPSLNFSYRPDMGVPANGYTSLSYIDGNGVHQVYEYNRYEGALYSPPGTGQSASLNFSIGNNLEAKVRDRNDTTGTGLKKIKLLDQLSINGSYNFLADSMNLSNINISFNTTIFEKLGVNGNISLDPYAVNEYGARIAQFNIAREGGFKLARLTSASVSLSYTLQGKSKSGGAAGGMQGGMGGGNMQQRQAGGATAGPGYERIYYHPITGEYIPGGWVTYMDPDIPWSVSFDYNYSYSRSYNYANGKRNTVHTHTQTLGIGAQIRLTKDLNINLNTGVDLMKMSLTTTQLSATYDLHCFQISFSWVPMGKWQQWSFRINAKASALADVLQYRKGSSFYDNRR